MVSTEKEQPFYDLSPDFNQKQFQPAPNVIETQNKNSICHLSMLNSPQDPIKTNQTPNISRAFLL